MSEINLADEARKLQELAEAKTATGEADREAKAKHKAQEQRLLGLFERLDEESTRPRGFDYTFTAVFDKVKGQVDDRRAYVRWCLEQEPSLDEFLEWLDGLIGGRESGPDIAAVREQLFEALESLTFLKLAERQDLVNTQARAASDDSKPPPPGVKVQPVPYVSVTKRA